MSVTHTRGDFLAKNGDTVITDSLTFCGSGGVDISAGGDIFNGTTTILNTTTLDNVELGDSVDGHLMSIGPFHKQMADTIAATAAKLCGSTNTQFIATKPGSLRGLACSAATALGAGHVTVTVYIGATASTNLVLKLGTGTQTTYTSLEKDTDTFAAGKAITVKMKCDNATTSTVNANVLIEM
jgi:hypothetical protein